MCRSGHLKRDRGSLGRVDLKDVETHCAMGRELSWLRSSFSILASYCVDMSILFICRMCRVGMSRDDEMNVKVVEIPVQSSFRHHSLNIQPLWTRRLSILSIVSTTFQLTGPRYGPSNTHPRCSTPLDLIHHPLPVKFPTIRPFIHWTRR